MDFKNVPSKYRPIPFWSWNEKLDACETKRQIEEMHNVGIGGFFMHARGGLQTEYMGEEWFENVKVSIDAAKENDMYAWAYDENGWPSGFGDGKVNGLGIEYMQKYLRISKEEPKENVIGKTGEYWAYYEVNPFYVDTLDKKVVAEFIKTTYEPYYEKYGNEITGFFTDEPQISRNGIPWSFVMEEEYQKRYGRNLLEDIPGLFYPVDGYEKIRIAFWKMVTDLFSEAFCMQIYNWCDERGLKFTGHLVCEENLLSQLASNGACMPHYEYFHIPGMDWLGRRILPEERTTPYQVASAAAQLGKKQVLSETFALCGHNVSFDELKGIYEWQMVRGINLLCQHLEGYSIRGMRKRDYPPAMYLQQPWWSEYKKFNDAMSRQGMILANGRSNVNILVIHPQTTAWTLYDNGENKGLMDLHNEFTRVFDKLEEKHLAFHLGDETLMERHGRVENGKLIIGECAYDCVLNPCGKFLLDNTVKLLDEYEKSGGVMASVDELAENPVIDSKKITYTMREYEDFKVHFFANNTLFNESEPKRIKTKINVNGKKLNPYTGELEEFSGIHEFEPWGSLMIIEDGSENCSMESEVDFVTINDELEIVDEVQNMITLDKCDYYFDGQLQEKNGYVLNICERANELRRKVEIHQDYYLQIDEMPEEIYLVCETPEIFRISVNGNEIDNTPCGFVIENTFKKLDVAKYLKTGRNVISFDCDFKQSDEVYENIEKGKAFESEKNKLVYDIEIESIYFVGKFGVKTNGEWEKLNRKATRYTGDFAIVAQPKKISKDNIEKQGFPFFCGEMKLKTEIDIKGENPVLIFDKKGVNAVRVKIGDVEDVVLVDNRISLKKFGVEGKTEVELTLINNLRNLLGPHHLSEGECYHVCPNSFIKEKCVWTWWIPDLEAGWNDEYCFVEFGI